MTIIEELKIFARGLARWFYSLTLFSFVFFLFGLGKVEFFGQSYIFLIPAEKSFSAMFFSKIRSDLLPPDVQLFVTNPMSAFVSQIMVSLFLSFVLTIPYFLYRIILYIKPALLPHEKRAVLWSLFPFLFLFFIGAAFSYYLLIPKTFSILYPYATKIGAVPFFSLDEFVYYVFALTISVGIMFLLPMFMILLSMMGIVKPAYWKSSWRYAILFFLILSAIITPDGTGVTMAILFFPLAMLYFAGYYFAEKFSG